MLPIDPYDETDLEAEETEMPSLTYYMDWTQGRIVGKTDGVEAMRQAIHLIFVTERFAWEIYTDNNGIELEGLVGENMPLIKASIEQQIADAIFADDRVTGYTDFTMTELSKNSLEVSLQVNTLFGTVDVREEITL